MFAIVVDPALAVRRVADSVPGVESAVLGVVAAVVAAAAAAVAAVSEGNHTGRRRCAVLWCGSCHDG